MVLLRSHKVLKAFQSRVKLSKSEIRRAKIGGIFFIFVIVLVCNLILAIAVLQKPVKIITERKENVLEKTLYCNTSTHLSVVIGFSIFLHLTCFVQAFRGRRLPGAFKETMPIVYGSFIAIVVFLTAYPVVFFQKNMLDRDLVFWMAVSLNLNLLVMFCYYRRLYIAIFKPHMNTVEYSRNIIMEKMSKESRSKVKTI